jgi:hypothetical protein
MSVSARTSKSLFPQGGSDLIAEHLTKRVTCIHTLILAELGLSMTIGQYLDGYTRKPDDQRAAFLAGARHVRDCFSI